MIMDLLIFITGYGIGGIFGWLACALFMGAFHE